MSNPSDEATPSRGIKLPATASPEEIVRALWGLPRELVSDGYDTALAALATQLPMTVHEYPTGMECWTWIVPEKWTCRAGYLETIDGDRLFSYEDHPLHVVSYSLPFDGIVSRAELDEHLHVHATNPEAIPWVFKFYERDWGLCCSQRQRDALTDDSYRVVIDSEFTDGTLKVGDVVAPGASPECIVLAVHLCHPAQVNDDTTGVAVAIEVMRRLLRRDDLNFTYRLLIFPETVGSVAFLSQHEDLITEMRGGLFFEMLGLDNPPALQRSYAADSDLDRCCSLIFSEQAPDGWTGAYRSVIGNDERQFNGPGVRVPMLSISRVLEPESPEWPYPEYHSSFDNLDTLHADRLDESVELAMAMIEAWDTNYLLVNRFKGEVFLSRYDLYRQTEPANRRSLMDVMHEIDGTQTVADIAGKLSLPFSTVLAIAQDFSKHGLVELKHPT